MRKRGPDPSAGLGPDPVHRPHRDPEHHQYGLYEYPYKDHGDRHTAGHGYERGKPVPGILWEGFYYGISAAVIGCITGYIGTVFVEAGAADVLRLTAVPVVPMACASLFAIGACILATCIPLWKISRMSIVDSIELVE